MIINSSDIDLDNILENLKQASHIACDIETTDLDILKCRVLSIQFAIEKDGEYIGWVINIDKNITLDFLKKKLSDVIFDKTKTFIFHNASFDVQVLALRGFHFRAKLADTMIMAWLIDEDIRRAGSYGLKQCVFKYLNYRMATLEEARGLFGNMDEYAADDAICTLKLYKFFISKLEKDKLVDWFNRVEMPITRILINAEMRGVMIDGNQLNKVKKECHSKLEEIQSKIYALVGYKFDIGSPKQLAHILFDDLKIGMTESGANKFSERGKSGVWSTSDEVLEAIKREWKNNDLPSLLLDYRELNTRLNVFIKPLLERYIESPIIHPRFIQIATVTGRFASRDPNYQNLPKKGGIRRAFIPRPGYILIRTDYSQAELRLVAHMSGDPTMLDIYKNNGDIHEKTAKECNISRQEAKACVSGDSMVLTENGFLRIDEIVRNEGQTDVVIGIMSDDGKIRNTESGYSPGVKPTIDIHTEYGIKLSVTPDHEIMVMDNGNIIRKRADQLVVGDPTVIMVGMNIHGNKLDKEGYMGYKLDEYNNIPRYIRESTVDTKLRFIRHYIFSNIDSFGEKDSSIYVCSDYENFIRQIHAEMANVGILGNIINTLDGKWKWVFNYNYHSEVNMQIISWMVNKDFVIKPKRCDSYIAKVTSITPGKDIVVYDLYEPERTAMVIGCNVVADCNFGIIYRMSANRLQSQLAIQGIIITKEEAYSYIKNYFRIYSKVKVYHQSVEKIVKERLAHNGEYGWVKTLGGRYRRLDKAFLQDPELQYTAITQAINAIIQGGVADLVKEAMIEINRIFMEKGWLDPENNIWDAVIQGQIHDELIVECKEELTDEVKNIVTEQMELAGVKYKLKVFMKADASVVKHLEKEK